MSLWFRPVCDDLLRKILQWLQGYERGEVYSTRPWLNLDGNVIELVTRYAHQVPLKTQEVQHWAAIMAALAPENPLTQDLAALQTSIQKRFTDWPLKNRPRLLPTNAWAVTLAWHKEDIEETARVLIEARSGKAQALDVLIQQQKEQGKELFEV